MIEAVTPKPALKLEGDDARMDSRYVLIPWLLDCNANVSSRPLLSRMLKDDRVHEDQARSIFNVKDTSVRMG